MKIEKSFIMAGKMIRSKDFVKSHNWILQSSLNLAKRIRITMIAKIDLEN